jgi:hypothetical protein
VYGQGVHCVSGSAKILSVHAASGGELTLPDYLAGDVQISVQSSGLGDGIVPGQSRYYVVDYRDPIVLGGCAPRNTINATQTAQIVWAP